ncbi:MAG: peptidyl-tRNA hydrolase, partial [Butyricicoccus sp.]
MYKAKQLIVMRRDLKMRKGKIAAQAGHACVTAILMALEKEGRLGEVRAVDGGIGLAPSEKAPTPLSEWFARGVAKICVYVDSEEELLAIDRKAKEAGILSALICDNGLTEFHGQPTYTCLAFE